MVVPGDVTTSTITKKKAKRYPLMSHQSRHKQQHETTGQDASVAFIEPGACGATSRNMIFTRITSSTEPSQTCTEEIHQKRIRQKP
jgi:hypothetical protein